MHTESISLNNVIRKLENSKENYIEYYENGKKCKKYFRDIYFEVKSTAESLNALNFKKGDKLGILGTSCYEWVIIDLACVYIGIITIPFDTNYKYNTDEIFEKYQLKALFTNIKEYLEKENELVLNFKEVLENNNKKPNEEELKQVIYEKDDEFTAIFTSGTQGTQKSVLIRSRCFDDLIFSTAQMFQFNSNDKVIIFLPMYVYLERSYIYAAILLDFNVLMVGMELVIKSFKLDSPTIAIGVPIFFESIYHNFKLGIKASVKGRIYYRIYLFLRVLGLMKFFPPFINIFGGKMRFMLSGSAPCSLTILKFYKKMGLNIYEGYGLSEIAGMVSLNYPGNIRLGSVGKIFPNKQVKFDSENQIYVKGENVANTKYFTSSKEENKITYLDDGYVATGDCGYMDKNNFLFINGRIKDIIVLSNGTKIHPIYIEETLNSSILIKHSVVYGDRQTNLVALIVPEDKAIEKTLIQHEVERLNQSLKPDYKILSFFLFLNDFSIENNFFTPNLKLNRKYIYDTYDAEFLDLYN